MFFLILGIAGNVGVAAYGIIANLSLIAMAVLNGIAQGIQPLLSQCYGQGDSGSVKRLVKMGLTVTIAAEAVLLAIAWGGTDSLIRIFNSQGNAGLLFYAHEGLRLYFLGYSVAGINILAIACFSATDRAKPAIAGSTLRGIAAIAVCAVVLSRVMGINGVWLSFLAAEAITLAVMLGMERTTLRESEEI